MRNHEGLGQLFHHAPHLVPMWLYEREYGKRINIYKTGNKLAKFAINLKYLNKTLLKEKKNKTFFVGFKPYELKLLIILFYLW